MVLAMAGGIEIEWVGDLDLSVVGAIRSILPAHGSARRMQGDAQRLRGNWVVVHGPRRGWSDYRTRVEGVPRLGSWR